jgi:hypothetical protein
MWPNWFLWASRRHGFANATTQAIAAAARFLEFDDLIVPSAQADCANRLLPIQFRA